MPNQNTTPYTPEFRATVVAYARQHATNRGPDIKGAADHYDVPPRTITSWLAAQSGSGKPTVHVTDDVLRKEVKQLRAELTKMQDRSITEEAIRRRIIGLTADVTTTEEPKWALEPRKQDSAPGVPTLFLSDLHWGEVVQPEAINGVNEYNVKIAHQRINALIPSALHLLKIVSPKMQYPGIVLVLGGDMISGNIHDELTATNELNSMPTVLDLYGRLVWVIEELLKEFPAVFVPCVTGNHGRDTTKIWSKDRHATSFDWLLYMFLAKRFETDKRVKFLVPDGTDAIYRIFNHTYLLTHGDQFRGGDGMIGCLGPILRGDHKKRSRNAQIDMEYDTMLMGHWHQYIHHGRVIVNGSLKGYDEYAYSNNFGFERPQQALWLTHPKWGITYRMPVQVDRTEAKMPAREWVSFTGHNGVKA